ncbi:hypothetical protein HY407_00510 [Candidatus Gottesmanbacteria bacterium]|nr:hypothetical protein [Candidatus Gottesmanbacteria bacterium]
MKTNIAVHIPNKAEIVVSPGENIKREELLAKTRDVSSIIEIELAKILGVTPQKISKFLKKKIGEKVARGELIAHKKSLFSTIEIKSPEEGIIEEINLKDGNLIFKKNISDEKKVLSPFSGKISEISEKNIIIECEIEEEYEGEKALGQRVWGKLQHIKGDFVGVLEVMEDIEESIILVNNITSAALAKLDALGANGVITNRTFEEMPITYISVSKNTFSKLGEHTGREIMIDPETNKVFVLS